MNFMGVLVMASPLSLPASFLTIMDGGFFLLLLRAHQPRDGGGQFSLVLESLPEALGKFYEHHADIVSKLQALYVSACMKSGSKRYAAASADCDGLG